MDYRRCEDRGEKKMAERNTVEELDDVYEIKKYSTDAMTGGADKRMYLYYQLADR